jgi:hypothetical protein
MKQWEAESSYAWSRITASASSHYPYPTQLAPLLTSIFDKTTTIIPTILNERHRLLVIQALGRALYRIKRIKAFPGTTTAAAQQQQQQAESTIETLRQNTLAVLDAFWRPPLALLARGSCHTQAEIGLVVQSLNYIHLAHIYSADNLMTIFYPFLRNVLLAPPSSRNNHHHHHHHHHHDLVGQQQQQQAAAAAPFKAQMLAWARKSPQQVRSVARHAAQILALARLFPEDSIETFNVFHAGVLLVCMARLLPVVVAQHQHQHQQQGSRGGLHIDYLGDREDATGVRVANWVCSGTDDVVGIHGVAVLCSKHGWKGVLDQTVDLLRQGTTWGLSRRLLGMVLKIRDEALQREWF